MTARAIFDTSTANPIVRAVVRSVSAANNGRYRRFYVPAYRAYMYLNLSEPLALRRLLGRYERPKMEFFRRHLKPGMTFVDVGANLGDFSLVASRLVGNSGRVISFEPDPGNCQWLRESIAKNELANVELREEALSNTEGQATFFLGDVSGWHTLKGGQLQHEKGRITVATRRLDSLGLDRIDVMKIDVEGAELEVLQGAHESLRRCRPLLLIDLHPHMGADVAAVAAMLRELGYQLHTYVGHGKARPFSTHEGEVFAVPPGRTVEAL